MFNVKDKKNQRAVEYSIAHRMGLNWIDKEGWLPEAGTLVLIAVKETPLPDIGWYDSDRGCWCLDDSDKDISKVGMHVVAWLPLPERYRAPEEADGYAE